MGRAVCKSTAWVKSVIRNRKEGAIFNTKGPICYTGSIGNDIKKSKQNRTATD